jgi:hypothetical protein
MAKPNKFALSELYLKILRAIIVKGPSKYTNKINLASKRYF